MGNFQYQIVPYSAEYEPALLELERYAQQGNFIQMEMLRDSYLSRSVVFEKSQVFLALGTQGQLMGALAAAMTPLWQNGAEMQIGVCYDVRVDPAFRGHGLTRKMGLHAARHFYEPNHAAGQFLTMKANNEAVYKSAKILGVELYRHPFVYLTIPTYCRVGPSKAGSKAQRFRVLLSPEAKGLEPYYTMLGDGLGIWHTYLMYRLQLRKLHIALQWGIRALNMFRKMEHRLPSEGDDVSFASLFGCTPENKHRIDEALQYLQQKGIGYLSVCCAKGDFLYTLLKPLAINEYPYILLSTFPTQPTDEIGIEVRCL